MTVVVVAVNSLTDCDGVDLRNVKELLDGGNIGKGQITS